MIDQEHFVQIANVSKHFSDADNSSIHVIDDVSMNIAAGEFVVYLGPSGCGKTTLMRMVGGLETVSAGVVKLDGAEVIGPDRHKGMVFQTYTSFPWLTVFENIQFGTKYRTDISPKEKTDISRHYLDLVGLTDFADFFVNRISGGMRQRVAIARTLAAGPDILLMDEPFGALDAQTREYLQLQLLEISRIEKKAVIFVTHDVEEAVILADRIFIFSARPAKVIEEINVGEILKSCRTMETKETEEFFHLRNRVRSVMHAQESTLNIDKPGKASTPAQIG
jgi:NitT/TauT family transport system ATP-binding protein